MEQTQPQAHRGHRYTAVEMFDLVARCKTSGQSVQSFCSLHGLTEGRYYYWQKKYLNRQSRESSVTPEESFSFVKLPASTINNESPSLFAEVGSIRLYREVPASYLKELIG